MQGDGATSWLSSVRVVSSANTFIVRSASPAWSAKGPPHASPRLRSASGGRTGRRCRGRPLRRDQPSRPHQQDAGASNAATRRNPVSFVTLTEPNAGGETPRRPRVKGYSKDSPRKRLPGLRIGLRRASEQNHHGNRPGVFAMKPILAAALATSLALPGDATRTEQAHHHRTGKHGTRAAPPGHGDPVPGRPVPKPGPRASAGRSQPCDGAEPDTWPVGPCPAVYPDRGDAPDPRLSRLVQAAGARCRAIARTNRPQSSCATK